ncbi:MULTISPECIES: ATP-binding cassette domain-containing protein [unclassified Shewanella]|uniref:ATP-binding cassette domain-containing protein n=1 Tax=unclassified Shewanella TaxID=196818 RepID=UPI001BC50F37|nr:MULTISPECIES: ATP-binding cassette domain-containing protein [unclassified Shewanella]GIU08111.1 phosphonates import ATP-binding protein PhnC 1 [Shewanella sp. MBTL60-112-B1]GIU40678.1 phosphonates import ATP-binding protein PhnC 1 [Shewanella sp. MBTL60-112-B2]
MLTVEQLVVQFEDKTAVSIDELSFYHGEKVAIIGRSGCGKSTLINHVFEQLRPTAALCSQRQGLVENLSVFHNIFMGALNRHSWIYNLANLVYPFKGPRQAIQQIADTLELDCSLSQAVSALSGGQRQRVALGRALYQRQALFIGDEAFSALDPVMGQRLLTQVLDRHRSVIMVLHDMDMALTHFDRVIGLREGKKVLDIDAKFLNLTTLEAFYKDSSDTVSAGGLNEGDKCVKNKSETAQIEPLQSVVKRY